eukprot:2878441-Pleurochrysis_carterae.AAC.1
MCNRFGPSRGLSASGWLAMSFFFFRAVGELLGIAEASVSEDATLERLQMAKPELLEIAQTEISRH